MDALVPVARPETEDRLAAALAAHHAGDLAGAIAAYVAIGADDPDEVRAHYLLGVALFEAGRPAEAADAFERAVALRPRNIDALTRLATLRRWLGEPMAAAALFRRALDIDAAAPGAGVGLSFSLLEAGEPDRAREAAFRAVEAGRSDPEAHVALAACLASCGQPLASASAYRDALRLDPARAAARAALAAVLLEAGRPHEAAAAAEAGLAQDPHDPSLVFARGAALAALRRFPEARADLERAVAIDDTRATARLMLGNVCAELEDLDAAERHLLRAAALDPALGEAFASLGAVYLMAGRKDLALDAYRRAHAANPDLAAANLSLAGLLEADGDIAGARAHRDRAYSRQTLFIEAAPDPARRVLVISTARDGNIPFRSLLPLERFTRLVWVPEYAPPDAERTLPDYDVVFNAMGDWDMAAGAEARVAAMAASCAKPWLNRPENVARTTRDRLPGLLNGLDGVIAPATRRIPAGVGGRAALELCAGLGWPRLVRPAGAHGGKGVILADDDNAFADAVDAAASDLFATEFVDYRSPDGRFRKFRVIFVGGQPFPYHLAIGERWLLHHGTAAMDGDRSRIDEELAFLEDPERSIGDAAVSAVAGVGARLGLDYAGVDFGRMADGRILIFEANATMLVHREPAGGPFEAKNRHVDRILDAFAARVLDAR